MSTEVSNKEQQEFPEETELVIAQRLIACILSRRLDEKSDVSKRQAETSQEKKEKE